MMLAAAVALVAAAPALAEDAAETPAVSLSYNAAVVSDYRFRGLSYTNRDPTLQVGADLAFKSGFFIGTWMSGVANTGGSNVEVDLYGGYGGSVAGFDYTASVLAYLYPGGKKVNYVELQSTIARKMGPVTGKLTLAYTPDQWNTGDNLYTALGADVAIGQSPLSASFSIGRENGSYDEKWDWSAGLAYQLDKLQISASYVDSNYKGALEAGHNGGAGAVLSVKASF